MNQERRKQRLQELLQRMRDGHDVAVRDLKNILTDEEYNEFLERWQNEKEIRTMEKPPEIKVYELLLRKMRLAEVRYDTYVDTRKNRSSLVRQKLANDLDNCLEKVCDYWREIVSYNRGLVVWFDRQLDFEIKDKPSNDFDPPRVVTSRSFECQHRGIKTTSTKRELKILILEQSIDAIENPSTLEDVEQILIQQLTTQDKTKLKSKFKDFKV